MARYVLEGKAEFKRLEVQAASPDYDVRRELAGIELKPGAHALDAGCGSGVGVRHLAHSFPEAQVLGCDISKDRVAAAAEAARNLANASFVTADLTADELPKDHFDVAICRFVVEHLAPEARCRAFSGLYGCLKHGGLARVIDIDGGFHNLHPLSRSLKTALNALASNSQVDLFVGRKLPALMTEAGFSKLSVGVETLVYAAGTPEMTRERELMRQRFEGARTFFESALKGAKAADRFFVEFLETLTHPGALLFYNKFIVTGHKSRNDGRLKLL